MLFTYMVQVCCWPAEQPRMPVCDTPKKYPHRYVPSAVRPATGVRFFVLLNVCALVTETTTATEQQELVVEELVRMTDALSREANLQIIQALRTLADGSSAFPGEDRPGAGGGPDEPAARPPAASHQVRHSRLSTDPSSCMCIPAVSVVPHVAALGVTIALDLSRALGRSSRWCFGCDSLLGGGEGGITSHQPQGTPACVSRADGIPAPLRCVVRPTERFEFPCSVGF